MRYESECDTYRRRILRLAEVPELQTCCDEGGFATG